ncbi:MAG TPA: phage baseplate assembly protein V [Kofleriaceae bacterium]|nr:phage baseplate assembly protein V [Kofleriaceae bacterium]
MHYGIVVQNKDPDNLDRIKVRFPWLDDGETDQSHWVQLVTPMEGPKFGWYTLPDIGDVVVIAFIAGDSSQPVVLGGVWSTPDFSPETNEDGKNNFRGFRSRAGHRMVFDDSPGGTKFYIADKTAKNMIGMGKFAKDGAGPNVCAVWKPPMSGDGGISVSTMEGKMEITAKTKLSIKAQQNIKINAKTTIDIKAGTDFQMEGTSAAKLTSSNDSNYDAPKIDIE